jgi:hypothetical protein
VSNTDFITALYQNALGRDPEAGAVDYWNSVLVGGTSRVELVNMVTQSNEGEVKRLYSTTFDRPADPAGEQAWINVMSNGANTNQIANAFTTSAEFQSDYANISISDFVTDMYHNALHRNPDAGGLNAWVSALQNGMNYGTVIAGFSDSQESIGLIVKGLT